MTTKVTPLYTKLYFTHLYNTLLTTETHFITDGAYQVWHIDDVEDVLIKEYGELPPFLRLQDIAINYTKEREL